MNKELKEQIKEEIAFMFGEAPEDSLKFKKRMEITDYVLQKIDKTVQSERERIVGMMQCQMEDIEDNEQSISWNDALKRIISLITNKNDINKDKK